MYENIQTFLNQLVQPSPDDWVAFKKALKPVSLAGKAHFLEAGQVCSRVAFVNRGCARQYYLVDGKEICKDFLFENSFIGSYASFLTRQPAHFYVQALENMELLELQHSDIVQLYANYPTWQKLGKLIAEGLFIRKENREASFLNDGPDQRYQKLLVEFPQVIQRVPLHYIASYLGMTPETLSRIRRRTR